MRLRLFATSLLSLGMLSFGAFAGDLYVSKNNLHEDGDRVVWGTYQTDDGIDHDAYTDLQAAVSAAAR